MPSHRRISTSSGSKSLHLPLTWPAVYKPAPDQSRWGEVLRPRAMHQIQKAKSRAGANRAVDAHFRGHGDVKAPRVKGKECKICAESKGIRQFPDPKVAVLDCGHGADVCKTCILHFTTDLLEIHGQWSRVSCTECPHSLNKNKLAKLLPRGNMDSLEAIVLRKVQEADPRFRYCTAPGCSAGQVHEDIEDQLMICTTCSARSCLVHSTEWHENLTCQAYDDTHPDTEELKKSVMMVRAKAKRCPGAGCGFFVEKNGGCNPVRCSNCHHVWNWTTLRFGLQRRRKGLRERKPYARKF